MRGRSGAAAHGATRDHTPRVAGVATIGTAKPNVLR